MENSFSFIMTNEKAFFQFGLRQMGKRFAKVLETISKIWQRFNKSFHYA
jgi:hypothetical protein